MLTSSELQCQQLLTSQKHSLEPAATGSRRILGRKPRRDERLDRRVDVDVAAEPVRTFQRVSAVGGEKNTSPLATGKAQRPKAARPWTIGRMTAAVPGLRPRSASRMPERMPARRNSTARSERTKGVPACQRRLLPAALDQNIEYSSSCFVCGKIRRKTMVLGTTRNGIMAKE